MAWLAEGVVGVDMSTPSALEHETLPKRVSDDPRQSNFRPTKKKARFLGLGNRVLPFWESFGASSEKRTSKSTSVQLFALDSPIKSSVRSNVVKNMSVDALQSIMHRRQPPLSPTTPLCSVYGLRPKLKINRVYENKPKCCVQ